MRELVLVCLLVAGTVVASSPAGSGFVVEVIEHARVEKADSGVKFSFGDVFGEEWKGELPLDTETWGAGEVPSYFFGYAKREGAPVEVPNNMYVGKMELKSGDVEVRLDVREGKLEKGIAFGDRVYYLAKASDYFNENRPDDSYVVYAFERVFPVFSEDGSIVPADDGDVPPDRVGAVQGDGTFSTFPGIYLYGDNEFLKAFASVGDAVAHINSVISSVNGILAASNMKQLTVLGSVVMLDSDHTTVSDCPYSVLDNILHLFGHQIHDLCDAGGAAFPDMALLFTGNAFSSHGLANIGTACGMSYARDVTSCCHALQGRAEDAGGIVDMCTSVSNAAYRARYQIHYAAHVIGHLLGAGHMSTDAYMYDLPYNVDWIMADHDDYDAGYRPSAPAEFHSSSRTQCMESCLYLFGFHGPQFIDLYDS